MTDKPDATEVETNPEIVDVEHPEPAIIGTDEPTAEPEPTEPNADQAADEDEDRQAGIGKR
jgi:hypothetical protein